MVQITKNNTYWYYKLPAIVRTFCLKMKYFVEKWS